MSYGSRTVSYNRIKSFMEDGERFLVMEYASHYEIYPASLKYSKHFYKGEDCSTYFPLYYQDRLGCLREETFNRLVKDGILVEKTPDHTRECYKFYAFPGVEIKLYGSELCA